MRPVMSYIRVSTGKQGKIGPGIEAQREAISPLRLGGGPEGPCGIRRSGVREGQ